MLIEHTHAIRNISFSADGKTLAGSDVQGTALLWDVGTGELQQTLETNANIIDVSISPDGQILALASANGLIRMWDVRTDELLYTLEAHANNNVSSVAFSPDG